MVEAAGAPSSDLFVAAVAEAFVLHARGRMVQPLKPYLRWRPLTATSPTGSSPCRPTSAATGPSPG